MPRRPDLFIVGAPKCGTTAMTRYLEAHPEVFVAGRKDLHFYGSDLGFRNRAREPEADYLARFAAAGGARWACDSSVWYLYSARAAAEMAADTPDARIIAMIRHPVDAMHALWSQLRLNGLGDEDIADFAEALAAEPDRRAGRRVPAHTPLPSALRYREVVAFSGQLQRYLDAFGPDRVRVIVQEEMKADTAGTVRDTYAWLGVDPDVQADLRRVNTSKAVRSEGLRRVLRATPSGLKDVVPAGLRRAVSRRLRKLNSKHAARTPLDPALRARLADELAPEIARIEAVLGRPVPAWRGP
jgi:hypothetical protein